MARRVALIGYFLECNAFSPVTREQDFRVLCHAEGDEIVAMMRAERSVLPSEVPAFARTMDALGEWTPVPISVIAATPGGPVEQDFYDRWLAGVREGLRAAGALDAVYIANHGAGAATGDMDSDGTLYALVREAVGAQVPVVTTTDLHANLSERMVEAADLIVTYRTNPHVDQAERGAEAAEALHEIWAGVRPATAFIRLPICPPSVTLLTAEGPFADLVAMGQREKDQRILNVSIFGNFTFSDLPKNGLSVLVTARGDASAARALCLRLARRAWDDRHRFQRVLTSLDEAVAGAVVRGRDPAIAARILADVADNPGGGGSGRTVALLRALHEAGAQGVILGMMHDPALAAEAHALGAGARFKAVFNRDVDLAFVEPFAAEARVVRLHEGTITGRRGNRSGRSMPHGPSCLLDLGGVQVAVASNRLQCLDPAQFEMFGLDVAAARTVVVKSRGHFRAGFDDLFPPDRTDEIDAPGLTSPVLSRFQWRHLPRPVFPLDPDAAWTPPDW